MVQLTINFDINIDCKDGLYDYEELEKVLKKRLVGFNQSSNKMGHTFKITRVTFVE